MHVIQESSGKEMLTINCSTSADGAKKYFDESLTTGDYYMDGEAVRGVWHGKLAEKIGLKGPVTQHDFHKLCVNIDPKSGENLTAKTVENRRIGYDFTFSLNKSCSLAWMATKDENIIKAFQESVRDSMAEIESDMKTRVRKDGRQEDRETGNLIWAEFLHHTSRPVDGKSDPQLHIHAFAFNASLDPVENQVKAGQFGDVKRDAVYYQNFFHSRMSGKMKELGYNIEHVKDGWELAGVSRELIDKYSRRTRQIERIAKEKGITDPAEIAALGKKTRNEKLEGVSLKDQRKEWVSRLSFKEKRQLLNLKRHPTKTIEKTTEQAYRFAMDEVFERKSVISEKRLWAETLKQGYGSIQPAQVKSHQPENLLRVEYGGEVKVTTKEQLSKEKEMMNYVRQGRGKYRSFLEEPHNYQFKRLNDQQRDAVSHILNKSTDLVTFLEGSAGVGKTTLLSEVKLGIEDSGRKVFAFAPSSEASRGVMRREGFDNAETVQQLFVNQSLQNQVRGQVLLVDEAGLLSVKDTCKLLEIAKSKNCRILLSGDTNQHRSVEAGDAVRILKETGCIQPITVDKILRQKNDAYREAVQLLANDKLKKGYDKLNEHGMVHEIDHKDAAKVLAGEYINSHLSGREALVISPTWGQGDRLTNEIRSQLNVIGALKGKAKDHDVLSNLNWTESEKQQARKYEQGQVIKFTKGGDGFRRGEIWEVDRREKNDEVIVRNQDGKTKTLSISNPERFQVLKQKQIPLQVGEKIRFTENTATKDRTHRLNNGSVYSIREIYPNGDIILHNGWKVAGHNPGLDHAYVSTSHSAQGKTVDDVYIQMNEYSKGAVSKEQFYVSVSRGKYNCKIFTSDKKELEDWIQNSTKRTSATELTQSGQSLALQRERHFQIANQRIGSVEKLCDRVWSQNIKSRIAAHYKNLKQLGPERIRDTYGR